MKKLISLNLLVFLFVGACNLSANPLPNISTKYSDDEIDKLIMSFKMEGHTDTYPTAELTSKFLKDFPKAKDVEWEKGGSILEVEFEIGRYDYKAYYDSNTNLIMYEAEIPESDLPAVVKNAALGKYPNYRLDEIEVVKKGTQTFYKVELKTRIGADVKMRIDDKGAILSERLDD